MADYDTLDYIPVIGDIYRYGKLGWKIGSWLSNDSDNYNNGILSQMAGHINNAAHADNVIEAMDEIILAAQKVDDIDNNCKKYQAAIAYYLAARAWHIIALCECITHANDLRELKKVGTSFATAKKGCNKVWTIDKTILTTNREIIDQVRQMADEKKKEISDSRKKWRKQYRCLYKSLHPAKWYLGMWLFA